ncbi:MAG: hypothetical protein VR72_13080 [Clostridiaceae bacterium BRH_c20a]|nr:MAG: hypothetical protein VR72_13080 [Clostridiaceae bacterium BRH_c20a]
MFAKKRISIVLLLFTLVALALAGCNSEQSSFPEKNINIIVPFGTGGGSDQLARVLGDLVDKEITPSVVVANKVGASGAVGMAEIAKAKPDGYTVLIMTANISTLKWTGNTELTYEDFQPVCAVNYDAPALVVRSDSPWKTYNEFADEAKSRRLKLGTGAPGGLWAAGALALDKREGLNLNIITQEKGGAPAAVMLLGEHVDAIVLSPNEAASQLENKDFRILGIMGPDRNILDMEGPTFSELGVDLDIRSPKGFLVPKNTPADVVESLEKLFKKAYESETYQDYNKKTGTNAIWMGTKEYTDYLADELNKYRDLLKETGMTK